MSVPAPIFAITPNFTFMHISHGGVLPTRIQKGEKVVILSDTPLDTDTTIYIEENAQLALILVRTEGRTNASQEQITIHIQGEGGQVLMRMLAIATPNVRIQAEYNTFLQAPNTVCDALSVAFARDASHVNASIGAILEENAKGAKAQVHQEGIFLGNSGEILATPRLDVHTDDVEAAHSARMERINAEELFFFGSRGMPQDHAIALSVESRIERTIGMLRNV